MLIEAQNAVPTVSVPSRAKNMADVQVQKTILHCTRRLSRLGVFHLELLAKLCRRRQSISRTAGRRCGRWRTRNEVDATLGYGNGRKRLITIVGHDDGGEVQEGGVLVHLTACDGDCDGDRDRAQGDLTRLLGPVNGGQWVGQRNWLQAVNVKRGTYQ